MTVSTPTDLLEVSHVAVRFGGLVAIADMTFSVAPGKIVSLIGPNGAGKTTAFNVITGYLRPSAGRVLFKGRDLTQMSPPEIAELGVVRTFQRTSVFNACTVLESVVTALHLRGTTELLGAILRRASVVAEEQRLHSEAEELLDIAGLSHRADAVAGTLAYGEQRLLALAMALAAKPIMLLLDEPAAGLNPSETQKFMELIRNIRDRGVTVLLVEHDMHMVMSISDRIVVLNNGQMIAGGSPQEIQNNPEVIRAYLGEGLTNVKG
ncbi:ABC transporter ATP-binding protein [Bradyrhizobium sp. URHD0069]|uniref:ABC transporter ATP-binding protein n=1 Tax=Bradyrhizobium sp. URHD0069 TaxID=1380355 RepID=UPI0004978EC0|nr:ABC transporter ATP-binding protein [Bradyrhizobium sp. URHD0069]